MTLTTHEPLTVTLGSSGVTPEDVVAVARHTARVTIAPDALDNVAKIRAHIDRLAHSETPAYGISTGFGALANRHIPNELRTQLQKSLIRSHAAGMGPAVEREVVRGIMFLRAKTLASGRWSCRPWWRSSTPASLRWSASSVRSAAPATSPRCRTAPWCSWVRVKRKGPTA
ncbi:hypothetical protein ABIB45_003158 [Arthrobacter sp. UYCo732]